MDNIIKEKFPWYLEKLWWPLCRLCNHPSDYYRKLKWFFQKKIRGYSDCDIWNLNSHLSELIYQRLVAFKKMKRMCYVDDLYEHDWLNDEFKEKWNNNRREYSIAAWEIILDKMIRSFNFLRQNDYDNPLPLTSDGKLDMCVINKSYQENMEGLDLFAKYFTKLSD